MTLYKNNDQLLSAELKVMQQLWESYGDWYEMRINFVSSTLEIYEKFYRAYRLKVFIMAV
jgi:hypothetical protein